LDRDPATGCSSKAALLTRKRGREKEEKEEEEAEEGGEAELD
jgi:hypothetical protein